MPFAHAHRWLLPLIALAFGPNYVGQMHDAPVAMHLHGAVATSWMLLVGLQSWAAHHRRLPLHRLAGRAIFGIAPLFAVATLLLIKGEARLGVDEADPFHAQFAFRLAVADILSLVAFLTLVGWALRRRRHVAEHAAAIWATVLLALPPILGRLGTYVVAAPAQAVGVHPFHPSFELAQLVAVAICLRAASKAGGAAGRPFPFVAATLALESLLFETVAASPWWSGRAAALADMPSVSLVVLGLVAGVLVTVLAWTTVPPRRRLSPATA